jgi:hypothetical protein
MATLAATPSTGSNIIAPHPAYPPRGASLRKSPAMNKAVQIQTPPASPPKPPAQRPVLRHIRRAISRSPPLFSPPDAPLPSIPSNAQRLSPPSPKKEPSLPANLSRKRSRSINVTLPTREPADLSYLQRARSSSPSSLLTVDSITSTSTSSAAGSSNTSGKTSVRWRPLPAIPVPQPPPGPSTSTTSGCTNSSRPISTREAGPKHHGHHHSNSISSIASSHTQQQPTRSGKRQLPPIPLTAIIASLPDDPPRPQVEQITAVSSASASISRYQPSVVTSPDPLLRKRELELLHSTSASPYGSPSQASSSSSSSTVEQITTPSGTIAFSVEVAGDNADMWDFSSPLMNFVHSVNSHGAAADVPATPDPSATSIISQDSLGVPVSLNERFEARSPKAWPEVNEIHSSLRVGRGISMQAVVSTI